MGRLMDRAKDKIHTRTIRMSTFAVDETHILSTGHFQDVRHFPSSDCAGRSYCAGTLHDLEIHVLLKTPEMVIEDIEVFVNTVPRQDCTTLSRSLDSVVGLSIARGFTNKVKELSGGTRGCTHLVHLLSTMAPAILQGYWAATDCRKDRTEEEARNHAASSAAFLKNSCYAWREDGEAYGELMEQAEN